MGDEGLLEALIKGHGGLFMMVVFTGLGLINPLLTGNRIDDVLQKTGIIDETVLDVESVCVNKNFTECITLITPRNSRLMTTLGQLHRGESQPFTIIHVNPDN